MSSLVTEHLSCANIACLFGSMIKKAHPATTILNWYRNKSSRCEPKMIFSNVPKIEGTNVGYGTYFENIMKHYTGQKNVILITDSEQADNLESRWLNEKNRPKGSKLIIWQLKPYGIKISKDPSVIYVNGYSDRILGLIKQIIESDGSQIEEIEKISL